MGSGEVRVNLIPFIGELPPPDVRVVTSGGSRIPAHGSVLGKMSPVLDAILDRPCTRTHRRGSETLIPIPGVPCKAVAEFVRFMYSHRCADEEIEKYGVHLLTLSHVYMLPTLKHRCTKALIHQLTFENVVDKLKLSRLCDAPYLYLKCMNFIEKHFKEVKNTEGWIFLQLHDPWLELEILQFIDETETRRRKSRKLRKDQSMYLQLSEAMDCLEHICTEGCTTIGPHNVEPTINKAPCSLFSTCHGLQMLIRHFAQCKKRVNGGCLRCKRMWQLLQLHSSICEKLDGCQVPLCRSFVMLAESADKGKLTLVICAAKSLVYGPTEFPSPIKLLLIYVGQFKLKLEHSKGRGDTQWKLLVKKVVSAKAMSCLLLPKNNPHPDRVAHDVRHQELNLMRRR